MVSASPSWSTVRPIERSRSAIAATSSSAGHVAQHERALRQDGGRHELEHRVLRPAGPDPALERSVGAHDDSLHPALSMLAAALPPVRRPLPHRGHGPQLSGARPGRTRQAPPAPDGRGDRAVGRRGRPRRPIPRPATVTAHFEAAIGPLRTYERAVEARPRPDGRFDVTERSHFELAIPLWGIAVRPRVPPRAAPHRPPRPARGTRGGPRPTASTRGRPASSGCSARCRSWPATSARSSPRPSPTPPTASGRATRPRATCSRRCGSACSSPWSSCRWPTGGVGAAWCSAPTIASCATTALGALAPNMVVLGATQVVSRGLSMAVVMLITVIAAEEMPAGSRAYAVSVMTMTGALGAGMCLWALPLTGLGDNGWRLLYVIPLLGIPVTLWVARYLPESRRFARPHRDVAVLRGHGRRMALLGRELLPHLRVRGAGHAADERLPEGRAGLLGVAHRAVHDADDHAGRHRAGRRRADGRRAREAVDRGGRASPVAPRSPSRRS